MSGQRYSGANQPPEHGERRTDPWGWLYREDGQVEQGQHQPPAGYEQPPAGYEQQPPSPQPYPQGDPQQPPPAPPTYPPAYPPAGPPDAGGYGYESASQIPVYEPSPVAFSPGGSGPGIPDSANPAYPAPVLVDDGPPRRRGLMVAVILGSLVLVVVIALVLVNLSQSMTSARTPATAPPTQASQSAPSAASSGSSAPTSQQTYDGKVSALTASGATAACVAPDATDGNGDAVSYAAVRAVDGDLNSAWRCDGDGVGQAIRVTVAAGSKVARLGLVNGYAKIDPATDTQRYPEYRRITAVRWELSTGATFEQKLKDKTTTMQNLAIPVQDDVEWVQLTIVSSTTPGSKAATRDAVLISEIQVAAPA